MEGQEQNPFDEATGYGYGSPETERGVRNGKSKETLNSIMIFSVGFFAIVFGVTSMWFSVSNPFTDLLKIGEEQAKALADRQKAEALAMQSIDTDFDGLTDYLELNKFNTSPYLKDSDGDGIDDKTEVDRNTDPNCPEGQACSNTGFDANSSADVSTAVPALTNSAPTAGLQITPDFIRQIMKQNGTTDEQLATLTDQDLLDGFNQFLKENPDALATMQSQGYILPGVAVSTTIPVATADLSAVNVKSTDDLKNLTGAQIRQLMISSGASSALLAAISDEQLKTMFIAQINSRTASTTSQQ